VIGSSTHRENIEVSLDVLGLRIFFREIVSAEDVSHGKPDPEVFLKAAEKDRDGAGALRGVRGRARGNRGGAPGRDAGDRRGDHEPAGGPRGKADLAVNRLDELEVGEDREMVRMKGGPTMRT
jgi:hypothetical protein